MEENIDESLKRVLTRLALAQEHMADDMTKMASHQAEMNGNVRKHTTQLALGSQWMKNHMGANSIHDVTAKRLDAMEKLAKVAIAIPTIIVVGGAVAGILALVL